MGHTTYFDLEFFL